MADKVCPDCSRGYDARALACSCGYRFPGAGFGWTADLTNVSFPTSRRSWALVALMCPITILFFGLLVWLGWFQLDGIRDCLLGLGLLVLPVVAQFLPSFRLKNGGCCLGCLAYISVAFGVLISSSMWSFGDPVREHEVPAIRRFRKAPCKVDGIELGEPLKAVQSRVGKLEEVPYPYVLGASSTTYVTPQGTLITAARGAIVRIEGKTFTQDGYLLAERGQPRKRVSQIFNPSSYDLPRTRYVEGDVRYDFFVEGLEIRRIAISKVNLSFVYRPTRVSVDGVGIGVPRLVLGEGKEDNGWVKHGKALVRFDLHERTAAVKGTRLEVDGKLVMTSDDAPVGFTQKYSTRFLPYERSVDLKWERAPEGKGQELGRFVIKVSGPR